MKNEFRAPDITRLFGVSRNSIQQYLDRGFIVASIQRSTKKGEPNIFSLSDLCAVRLFQKLLEDKLTWAAAHKVLGVCRYKFLLAENQVSIRMSNLIEIHINLELIEKEVLEAVGAT